MGFSPSHNSIISPTRLVGSITFFHSIIHVLKDAIKLYNYQGLMRIPGRSWKVLLWLQHKWEYKGIPQYNRAVTPLCIWELLRPPFPCRLIKLHSLYWHQWERPSTITCVGNFGPWQCKVHWTLTCKGQSEQQPVIASQLS